MIIVMRQGKLASMARTHATAGRAGRRPATAPDDPLSEVGPALLRLYRLWGRAKMQAVPPVGLSLSRKDLTRALIVGLVEEGARSGEEISVGTLADQLDVDPSAASRMVSDTIQAGYLRRALSQADARRALLELTDPGRELLNRYRDHQRAVFELITQDWTPRDQREFARLLTSYVDAMARTRSRQAASQATSDPSNHNAP
jgi:DNA-binding MarR family transcriptional regulator